MSKISKVEIEGFWNDKKVVLPLNEDVNFLIGVNGSGKTTIINLIAAVINVDFRTLNRALFSNITISFFEEKRKKAYITVYKNDNNNRAYSDIVYSIKDYQDRAPLDFSFNSIDGERMMNHEYYERRMLHPQMHRRMQLDIFEKLKCMINFSWVSVNRNSLLRKEDDRDTDLSIDKVLINLNNDMKSYLSVLSNKYNEEMSKFQQYIFSSLLDIETDAKVLLNSISDDLSKEKEALIEIYNLFGMFGKIKSKLNNQYEKIEEIKKKESISIEDFSYIFNSRKIHSIVVEWNKLTAIQREIFERRDTFLKVINSLLQRKQLIVNEKNELEVKTDSGKIFKLQTLSSGEKQLLLILGNGLLQENDNHIYIADEPELSLHIEWQEKLVLSLREVSPTSQIIFATHSPDIVGKFSSSVINIENVIYG